jgi:flagellar biosynthesis protein FlgN
MVTTITQEQASSNIEQSINACQKLLILIEEERDALKARDTLALERIIKDKSTNLLALEVGAKQRTAWLQAYVGSGDLEHAWAQQLTHFAPNLTNRWLQFKSVLEDCKAQNDINGKMLARNQQVVKRLVAIVRGQGDNPPLYSPKNGRGGSQGYNKFGEA